MKRVSILLALLMLCSNLWPAGLSFDVADRSFRFDSTHLSYNSATGYMKARFGPVEAGSLSGNWHVFSLFDSYAYAWKEHYVHTSGTLRGLALDFPEASFFLIHHPSLALGASTRLLGMELAVARIWRGEADDELFEVHGERSGFESFVMKLGYSDEHFMVRLKLTQSPDTGIDMLASAGLSWSGLGVMYTRGSEADVLASDRRPQEAFRVFLDSDRLYFVFSLERYGTPVRPGTYREVRGSAEVRLDLMERLSFTSRMESFFHEDGRWSDDVSFTAGMWNARISWSKSGGVMLSYDFGSLTFWLDGHAYGVAYEIEGPWYRMRVGISSSGRLDAALSIELP